MTNSPSTLIAHCGAVEMTREAMRGLKTIEPMGRWHKPIPHASWADKIEERAKGFGLTIVAERHAVQREHILFSTFDFKADASSDIVVLPEGRLHSIGTRGSNDQTLPREVGVGQRILVCDNGAFGGALISLRHKQTSGFNLDEELDTMFAKYVTQAADLEGEIQAAQKRGISDTMAKGLIFDAFIRNEVMPLRFMKAVSRDFFDPKPTDEDTMTDLVEYPKTLWALHNGFTRAARGLKPDRRFEATAKLGGLLKLASLN